MASIQRRAVHFLKRLRRLANLFHSGYHDLPDLAPDMSAPFCWSVAMALSWAALHRPIADQCVELEVAARSVRSTSAILRTIREDSGRADIRAATSTAPARKSTIWS